MKRHASTSEGLKQSIACILYDGTMEHHHRVMQEPLICPGDAGRRFGSNKKPFACGGVLEPFFNICFQKTVFFSNIPAGPARNTQTNGLNEADQDPLVEQNWSSMGLRSTSMIDSGSVNVFQQTHSNTLNKTHWSSTFPYPKHTQHRREQISLERSQKQTP